MIGVYLPHELRIIDDNVLLRNTPFIPGDTVEYVVLVKRSSNDEFEVCGRGTVVGVTGLYEADGTLCNEITVFWSISPVPENKFANFTAPLVRRVFTPLIAQSVFNVQPMIAPPGNIFYMDYTYGSGSLAPAEPSVGSG